MERFVRNNLVQSSLVLVVVLAHAGTHAQSSRHRRRRASAPAHLVVSMPQLDVTGAVPMQVTSLAAPPESQGVEVVANQDGIGLHIVTGNSSGTGVAAGYGWSASVRTSGRSMESICVAPCRAPLEPGTYNLAVSHETETPQVLRHLTRVEPGTRLRLEYSSRLLHRWIGAAVVGLSLLPPMLPLLPDFNTSQGSTRLDWFIGGSVACLSMMIVGLALVFLNDHYDIKVERGAILF